MQQRMKVFMASCSIAPTSPPMLGTRYRQLGTHVQEASAGQRQYSKDARRDARTSLVFNELGEPNAGLSTVSRGVWDGSGGTRMLYIRIKY